MFLFVWGLGPGLVSWVAGIVSWVLGIVLWVSGIVFWPKVSLYKGPKRQFIIYFFTTLCGGWGGRASGRLDHGLKTPSGEAALAADLITAGRTAETCKSQKL